MSLKLLADIKFQTIKAINQDEAFFNLYLSLFRDEWGKGYYCTNLDCGHIFPFSAGVINESNRLNCYLCETPLNNFYDIQKLQDIYCTDNSLDFNLVVDENNALVAFSCGKVIFGEISDGLLGSSFDIYKIRHPELSKIQDKIYSYFEYGSQTLSPVYFADSGGVTKSKRHSLEALIKSTKPLFDKASSETSNKIICINYLDGSMYKLNKVLGFELIHSIGNLAYIGSKDISNAVYLYENHSINEITTIVKKHLARGLVYNHKKQTAS